MHEDSTLIIGTWKMNLNVAASVRHAQQLKYELRKTPSHKQMAVCPSHTSIAMVAKILHNTKIAVGAQNCFWEEKGAFTGEISPVDLKELGCEYVILGHSERRRHLSGTDEFVHKRTHAALNAGLIPIVCVGETYDEKIEGLRDHVIIRQTSEALSGITTSQDQKIIIAYEPVWAIGAGAGIQPDPEDVSYCHEVIKQVLLDLFEKDFTYGNCRIIYGGNVRSENVHLYTSFQNSNGVLVGGASLDVEEFIQIINNA